MDSRALALDAVAEAWLRLEQAHNEVQISREEFLDSLINAQSLGITQSDMASKCINSEGHISRSRIAQYLAETKQDD